MKKSIALEQIAALAPFKKRDALAFSQNIL